jgi:cyclopropane fatty-acyl-phospholipid synthase-like methyltransferase
LKQKTVSGDVRHLYTESYFLNDATGHDEFVAFSGRYEDLIDKFRMVLERIDLKKNDSLLDIGCGRGEIVIFHAINGGTATGADFSEEAIKLASSKAEELNAPCTFIVSSFENLDESLKYDRIIALDFIEHISSDESALFFRKCFSLLKTGGKLLVFTYPNTIRRKYGYALIRLFSFIKMKPLPAREPDTLSEHYRQYHLNEQNYFTLLRQAESNGFSKVKVDYYDPTVKESLLKKLLLKTPARHLFLKGLTLIAQK